MAHTPPIYIMDGGLGTTLADLHGFVFDDSTPLWSSQLLLTDPATLQKCQTLFVEAGADLILTATYQFSVESFYDAAHNSSSETAWMHRHDWERTMREAIRIARASFGAKTGTVVLSLGAAGACLSPSQEYTGKYELGNLRTSIPVLRQWHQKRLQPFVPDTSEMVDDPSWWMRWYDQLECWHMVDLLAFETLPLRTEIIAVRDVVAVISDILESGTYDGRRAEKKGFWISCVFPDDGLCLPDGSSVAEVVQAMLGRRAGAETPMGIGLNCTKATKLEALIREYENAVHGLVTKGEIEEWPSLVVYPDGTDGETYNTTTHTWDKVVSANNDDFRWDEVVSSVVKRAQQRGKWKSIIVGGCCKTTPADIRKLRARLNLGT